MRNMFKKKEVWVFSITALLLLGVLIGTSYVSPFVYTHHSVFANANSILPKKAVVSSLPSVTLSLLTAWEIKGVSGIAWHPTDPVVAIAGWDEFNVHHVRLYDIQIQQDLWRKEIAPGGGVAFTPDGSQIAITSFYDTQLKLLDTEDGHIVSEMETASCTSGDWLLFSTTGNTLLTAKGTGHINWKTKLNLWDMKAGSCQQLDEHAGFLSFVDVNDNFDRVIMSVMAQERSVYVWDLAEKKDVCNLPGDFGLFVPGTQQFIVSFKENLSFYDTLSCTVIRELMIAQPLLGYIAFSPDGKQFVTIEKQIQIWETATGRILSYNILPDDLVGASGHPTLIFSPDGKYLLINWITQGEGTNVIQLWQVFNTH